MNVRRNKNQGLAKHIAPEVRTLRLIFGDQPAEDHASDFAHRAKQEFTNSARIPGQEGVVRRTSPFDAESFARTEYSRRQERGIDNRR